MKFLWRRLVWDRLGWGSLLLSSGRRLLRIVAVAARHGLSLGLGQRLERWPRLARRLPAGDLAPPDRLRQVLEDIGGTFIKFGQMLALQPDIISLEYCNALFNLLDRIEPFSFTLADEIFRAEHGRGLEEVFTDFDRQPLATASVGQVHVAWLDGQKVAVKIQRPDVEQDFGSDIRLMVAVVRLIQWLRLRPLYWLVEPTSEFIAWTEEEIDFRNEARYAERLAIHAADNPVQHVPRVWEEFTTRRILVMEFLNGVTLLEYLRGRERGDSLLAERLAQRGFEPVRFAANIIDNFLGDAFENGIYHADLHPANLLILDHNVVGYVDFGITGLMSRYSRRHLVAMTLALAEGDMQRLNHDFLQVTSIGPKSDLQGFRVGLDRLAAGWYEDYQPDSGQAQRLHANFTRIMGEMLTLSRKTGVLPERAIVKYIRSAIAIDGLITRFEPTFEVGAYLAKSCARYLVWQGRRERFTAQRLLDFSAASGKLFEHGPRRASRLLDRLTAGELPLSAKPGPPADRAAMRWRVAGLVAALLLATLALTLSPPPPALGANLWTAQLTFAGAAAVVLLCRLWVLVR